MMKVLECKKNRRKKKKTDTQEIKLYFILFLIIEIFIK
jgi:hypothetical protein